MGWLAASLKRLRTERVAAAGLVVLVLVTALVFGLAPRLLDAAGDEVLRDEVAAASVVTRNIQLVEESRLAAGDDRPMQRVVERGEQIDRLLPGEIAALVAARGWQVESGRHEIVRPGSEPQFLRLRWQEGIDEHIRYVEGARPTGATRELDGADVDGEAIDDVVVFEAAIARRTAEVMHLAVGDAAVLATDPSDPLVGPRAAPLVAAVNVVGIYEPVDPDADWWMADRLLQGPVVRAIDVEVRFYDGAALLADDAYPAYLASTQATHPPVRYTWRRFVDPARLDAGAVDALLVALRRAQTAFPTANPTPAYGTGYRTGLLPLVERQRAGWAAATAILAVVGLGPAVVALSAVGLVALLAAQRRRSAIAVARSRGASLGQLVAAVTAEGLLLTLPAVIVAASLAVLAVPGTPASTTTLVAVAVALATTAIVVATSMPVRAGAGRDTGAAGATSQGGRDTGIVRRPSARRLVGEASLVAIALAAAWLLRERGIRGTSSAGTLETVDPLIAAVPALVGLAAGVVAVRVLPLPMRLLAWVAKAGRGLVPVLALRRATSGAAAGAVLVVLLATATIGAFSSAALVHLDRGTETVAWQEIGGAYRVSLPIGPLPGTLDPERLPGVEAAAGIYRATVPIGLGGVRSQLLLVDVPGLEAVAAGTPADPRWPAGLAAPPGERIPAIVSESLGARQDGVDGGEAFDLSVEGYTLRYEAIEVRSDFPGVQRGQHFVVANREHFLAAAPEAAVRPTAMLLRAPDDRAAELRAAASEVAEGGTVESRAERTAALRGTPVAGAVRQGIVVAAVVVGLYAALAVAAALALAGIGRALEVAHLRTLGLSRRESLGLVVVEHGPPVMAAFGAGIALGLALFVLLRPGLGLAALVGSSIEVPLGVDVAQLLLIAVAIVGIVVVGTVAGAALQRAAAPAAAVRGGFE